MAAHLNPTHAKVTTAALKGVDVRGMVRRVEIRESVCTPYLSGEIFLVDSGNIINNLRVVGGELFNIGFTAPINPRVYQCDMYVLSIQGEVSPENLKSINYTISIVGAEYFGDRSNIVEKSVRNMPGASLAQQIWGENFTSKLITPVMDKMLSDGNEPFQLHHLKPFTAISQIRERMMFPQFKTGNTLLYRDRDNANLVPLEYLFSTLAPLERFVQKSTWGESWRDVFESEHAILDAKVQTRGSAGGRSAIQDLSATANQGKRVFDWARGQLTNNMIFGSAATGGATGSTGIADMVQGWFGAAAGGLGGSPNIVSRNSDRTQDANDFSEKTEAERLYAATVKAGPQYLIRVPLQTGINLTVGKGAYCNLLAPTSDMNVVTRNPADGLMLVTDLVHEVWNDMRQVQGTTAFQCIKGGFSF